MVAQERKGHYTLGSGVGHLYHPRPRCMHTTRAAHVTCAGTRTSNPEVQTQRVEKVALQACKHGLLPATPTPRDTTTPAGLHYSPGRQDDVAVPGRHSSGVVAFDYKNHKPVPLILNAVYLPPAAPTSTAAPPVRRRTGVLRVAAEVISYRLDAHSSAGTLWWG